MSFSLPAIEEFVENGGRQGGCQPVWLLSNPYRTSYFDEYEKTQGEEIFDYASEDVAAFLDRTGEMDRVQRLQCGLYLQYNARVEQTHFQNVRTQLAQVFTQCKVEGTSAPFIGLWTDAATDAAFDCAGTLSEWMKVVDAINTDLPQAFWTKSVTQTQTPQGC